MRYYLDTEFDEKQMALISLGIVAQDGREFYAINRGYDRVAASDWLTDNVMPHLYDQEVTQDVFKGYVTDIKHKLTAFLENDTEVEFYGYKSAWDIVLVHRLYDGYQGVLEEASNVPLVCYDLNQIAKSLGIDSLKDIVKPLEPEHHALVDARWNKFVHEQIIIQYGREL